jgi:hypothetical protein
MPRIGGDWEAGSDRTPHAEQYNKQQEYAKQQYSLKDSPPVNTVGGCMEEMTIPSKIQELYMRVSNLEKNYESFAHNVYSRLERIERMLGIGPKT